MEQSIFEKMGGTYVQVGDYLLPDFGQFETPPPKATFLGKYGLLRRSYLQEHRKVIYNQLAMNGQLFDHLHEVEKQAQNLLDTLIPQYKQAQGVTEELKATDQMAWVGMMNSIQAQIEEIIYNEIIYV